MISLRKDPSDPSAADTDARPLHVIVADDVAEIRELIAHWMEERGHTVTHANCGRDAIRAAHGKTCDLVITDILMPDGDGLDVILALKRAQPGTRILGISGGGKHMTAGDALRLAQAIGAHGMLLKPFTRQQLYDAVDQALAHARR